ncbi:transposase, partial [Levilactobacillus cerevisiae]
HLRVVLKASRSVDDLFWHFEYLVTTLKDVTIIDLFRAYHKRGIAENFIKEAKEGFGFDKTNSHSFQANNVRMWLAVLSYTLTLMFKQLVLSSSMQSKTIGTLRFQLFHIAGRVTTHAHKIVVHLSRSNPFIQLFWFSLHRIHQLD